MCRKVVVLMIVGFCVNSALASLPGSGTEADPYRIESLADFDEFAADPNYWDDYIRLDCDIDLSGRTYETAVIAPDANNSTSWFQGTAFTGVFDGDDHKITNLTINDGDAGNWYLGLFGYIDGGEVRNLGLEAGSVSGDWWVGGLVGWNDDGSVSDCYSTGDVTGDVNGHNYGVGGLVGENWRGSVSNCYSTGSVTADRWVGGLVGENGGGSVSNCYSTGDVSGYAGVGGLVGLNNGSVSNCYSTGDVGGDYRVGGLVGYNYESVSNCYSTGDVNGIDYVGGLVGVGYNGDDGSVSNCYSTGDVSATGDDVGGLVGLIDGGSVSHCFWDTETQTHGVSYGIGVYLSGSIINVAGLPTAQMQTKSTFTDAGWDFVEIWGIEDKQTYPFLRLTYPVGDLDLDKDVDFLDFAIFADHWLEGKGN